MKKLFYLLVITAVAVSCSSEPKYTVNGTIEGAEAGTVFLQLRTPEGFVAIDSAEMEKGAFRMQGFIEYPQMVVLTLGDQRRGVSFFLENSKITVTGNIDSLNKASITGSLTQTEFETYRASFEEMNNKMRETIRNYRDARVNNNTELAASLEKELQEMDARQTEMNKQFIVNNPGSFVTPLIISQLAYNMEATELETLLGGLDSSLFKVAEVAELRETVERMKAIAIGQKAPDFTLNDLNGNAVSLSSKIGGSTQLLLLDFWASWCEPCRQENPNVVKVWNEFNKKGFDVLGVSLDTDGEAWKAEIVNAALPWTHVSDLKGGSSEVAVLYAISAIPSNFLIDGNGVIVAHNLRGDDLGAKVKEILGSK